MEKKKLYLIDASSFIWRAFYGLPLLSNSKGVYVNAITGFGTMLSGLLQKKNIIQNNDKVLIIWDAGRANFRHDIYPAYKANRKDPPVELVPQFAIIKELINYLNMSSLEIENYEADDLIASYAKQATLNNEEVIIVSSDKDLMQLINDNVKLYDAMKDKMFDVKDVEEKFGVLPCQVVDFQAISGDSSDNIPGIAGLGPKGASALINEFGSLENMLKNIDSIMPVSKREKVKAGYELAKISYNLAKLKDDINLPLKISDIKDVDFDECKVLEFCEKYELQKLKNSLLKILTLKQNCYLEKENNVKESRRYDLNTNNLINSKELYIYPFFDTLKISQKRLLGLSIYNKESYVFLPLKEDVSKDLFATSFSSVLNQNAKELLKNIFENENIIKVIYDTKTLLHALSNEYDLTIKNYEDIHTLVFSLFGLHYGSNFNDIALNIVAKTPNVKDEEVFAYNAVIVHNIYKFALNKMIDLPNQEKLYKFIDKPLIEVLFKMEREGILFDVPTLNGLSAEFSNILLNLQDEIYKETNTEFNIASPKQLGVVLFEKMNLPYKGKKDSGYKTGVNQLQSLSEQGYKVADLILKHRAFSKLISTYTKTLIAEIDPKDKRIHTTFLQNLVNTGRLSSINPNLQNIPIKSVEGKSIRKAFVAKEGYLLLSCDYSQIELRIMAHIANVKNLIESFQNGEDIHVSTARKVFKCAGDICASERRTAKIINFGIIYGMSSFGLAQTLGVPKQEAREFIDAYFDVYPEIPIYMKSMQEQARKNGYVETLFHRKCVFDNSANLGLNYMDRASINAPIQGTSADLLRIVMKKVSDNLTNSGLDAKLLLQIHDELIFEVKESQINELKALVKETMENAIKLKVPLLVEMSSGKTLYDVH